MTGRRSSARIASQEKSSPASSQSKSSPAAGTKRKGEPGSSPTAKRGRKGSKKEQKTLEEIVDPDKSEHKVTGEEPDENTEDAKTEDITNGKVTNQSKDENGDEEKIEVDATKGNDQAEPSGQNDATNAEKQESTNVDTAKGETAVEPTERDEETPSSILEKGIVYFFFRGRVGIDHPSDPTEIARSYIVLRPLPHGAKLTDGPIGDAGNSRLLALPKKVLPKSPRDRFMSFVEKAGTSFDDLKESFLAASDYETKTAGTRHTPAATPIAEGIYAITSTGRESHLAYIITVPNELTEVQTDMGLRERGSFVVSLRNPQYEAPAGAQLPQKPEFPKDMLDEFRALRWMPLQAKHLNFANAQFLLIGESGGQLGKAVEEQPNDQQDPSKETPEEEMEKLGHEDEIRVKHLKGDDAVFADLGLDAKDYPKLQTTW